MKEKLVIEVEEEINIENFEDLISFKTLFKMNPYAGALLVGLNVFVFVGLILII